MNTSLHDRLPIAHGISTTPRGLTLHHYWGACSCGWSGPMRRSEVLAGEDLRDHQKGVA